LGEVKLHGMALAAVVGIILNLVLPKNGTSTAE
jgi:xanthine/uracil permease